MRYTLYGSGEGIRVRTDAPLWASHRDGLVTDASISARKLSIQPLVQVKTALSLAPGLLLIEEEETSTRPIHGVWERMYQFSPWLQTAGWDAFYLQVTGAVIPLAELRQIAQALDAELTCEQRFRIGFAENPFLARALVEWSRYSRVPGAAYRRFGRQQVIVSPALTRGDRDWLAAMPLRLLWLIPAAAKEQLLALGVYTVAHLRALSTTMLRQRFGRESLVWLQTLAEQSDRLTVNYPPTQRTASWVAAEQSEALAVRQLPHMLEGLAQEISQYMTKEGEGAMRVTLRWSTAEGEQGAYTRVAKHPIVRADFLLAQLLPACTRITERVTALSIALEGIRPLATEQLSFDLTGNTPDRDAAQRHDSITRTMLQINRKIPGGLALGLHPSYRELRHHLTVDGLA